MSLDSATSDKAEREQAERPLLCLQKPQVASCARTPFPGTGFRAADLPSGVSAAPLAPAVAPHPCDCGEPYLQRRK